MPISVPNVIARRKKKEAVQPPIPFYGIRRPKLNNVAGKPKGAGADGEVDPDADADADADGDGDADADADAEGDAGANDENAMDEGEEWITAHKKVN